MLTIKARIIIAATCVYAATLVTFGYLVYRNIRETEISKLDAQLQSHSEKIQTEIEEQFDEQTFPNLQDLSEIVTTGLPTVRTQLYDTNGVVVIQDSPLAVYAKELWSSPYSGSTSFETVTLELDHYRCSWFPVEIEDHREFVLLVAAPLIDIERKLDQLRFFLLIGIPATLVITALAAYVISYAAFRPLTRMVHTARDISITSLDRRIQLPKAKDEVRLLAETLNAMIDRIERAVHSQKQFIADASHEIRTPLTVITSELEYALQRAAEPPVRESIQTSLAEIERLTTMAHDLLLLARLDASAKPTSWTAVRLDEVLIEAVRLVNRLAAKKDVKIDVYVEDAVEIFGDRDKLQRIVINLLDNAVKYSNNGGRVDVALQLAPTNAHRARLTVSDAGSGIPEADLPKVFDRFFRVASSRSSGEGSGLGLAIVQKLVELHQGSIAVESTLGQGTTVILELPLMTEN